MRSQEASEALDKSTERIRECDPNFLREISLSTIMTLFPNRLTGLVAFCCTEQGSMGLVLYQDAEQPVHMVDIPDFTQMTLHNLLIGPDSNDGSIGGWQASYQRYMIP